ncbi:MAG: hypothetical protein E4H07_07020 [Nitrosomonadales bacterium]|nr:MAG: hypothetical protein E4H07_07020 [Nitrosomonadales bacterium]
MAKFLSCKHQTVLRRDDRHLHYIFDYEEPKNYHRKKTKMVKVFWRFKGRRIGGIFSKLADKTWAVMGKYATEKDAENAIRQWRKIDYLRGNFEFSVGARPQTI